MSSIAGPLIIDVAGLDLSAEDRELVEHPAVGGLILFSRNFETVAQLQALVRQIRQVRTNLLICVDYEGGRVQRFKTELTRIPPMQALGQLYERHPQKAQLTAEHIGWLVAAELAALGINMPLAPVVDIDYKNSEIIGDRALSHDASVISSLARAYIKGLRQAGSLGTAKHFPGHGFVAPDSHQELPVDTRSLEQLQLDMAPYKRLISQDLAAVMMAHIRYPAVDDRPASLSRQWIFEMLRKHCGFKGAVFCDDLSMGGAAEIGDYEQRTALALEAGCDWLPICNNRDAAAELLDSPALKADQGQANRAQMLARLIAPQQQPINEMQQSLRWQQAAEMIGAIRSKSA